MVPWGDEIGTLRLETKACIMEMMYVSFGAETHIQDVERKGKQRKQQRLISLQMSKWDGGLSIRTKNEVHTLSSLRVQGSIWNFHIGKGLGWDLDWSFLSLSSRAVCA